MKKYEVVCRWPFWRSTPPQTPGHAGQQVPGIAGARAALISPHLFVKHSILMPDHHGRQLLEVPAPALPAPAHEQRYGPLGPVSVGFSRVPLGRPPAGRAPGVPVLFRSVLLPVRILLIRFRKAARSSLYSESVEERFSYLASLLSRSAISALAGRFPPQASPPSGHVCGLKPPLGCQQATTFASSLRRRLRLLTEIRGSWINKPMAIKRAGSESIGRT